MIRARVLAPVLLIGVAMTTPAIAQASGGTSYPVCPPGKKIEQAESDAAHNRYIGGKVDYDDGHYDEAIRKFRTAYESDCTKHELLIIISRSYELKQDYAEAIRALETYLERQPNSADTQAHKNRIASMQNRLKEQQKAAAAAAAAASPPPPQPANDSGHTIYPWIVVGIGGAALATGAVLAVVGSSNFPSNCEFGKGTCNRDPTGAESEQAYGQRQRDAGNAKGMEIAGIVTVVGGAALVIGGLVWHFVEPTGAKESGKAKVRPELGPGYGGVAFTGRF